MIGEQEKKRHINEERTVHCPVEGCDATPLARGAHLHVMRSSGDGHGPQGEIPEGMTFDDLETAGTREVSMDYPEHRETERVSRLCPYCKEPFRGKHGVLIHLGQKKDEQHPRPVPDDLDPESFAIARVDKHDNVIDIVEDGELMPSTEQRRAAEDSDAELSERIIEYLHDLRDRGKDDIADEIEERLLRD